MKSKKELAKEYVGRCLQASKQHDITSIINTLFIVAAMVAFQQKINLTTPQMFFVAAVVFAGLKSLEMIVDATSHNCDKMKNSEQDIPVMTETVSIKEDNLTKQQKIFSASNPATLLTVAAAAVVGLVRGEKSA